MYRYRVITADKFRNASVYELHDLINNTKFSVDTEHLKGLIKEGKITNMTLKNGRIVGCPDVGLEIYSLLTVSEVEREKMRQVMRGQYR